MNKAGYDERSMNMLRREAGNEPWVLEAILQRENIVDEIVESGGMHNAEELSGPYKQAVSNVELRKQQLGITEDS